MTFLSLLSLHFIARCLLPVDLVPTTAAWSFVAPSPQSKARRAGCTNLGAGPSRATAAANGVVTVRSSSSSSSFADQVHVYDCVFSPDACSILHDLAVEHDDRSADGSSVFYRDNDKTDLTPLERALDSCLIAMGDTTSTVVEYWSRHEYINIDVHADMDEEELEESGRIVCPEWGHVLYLEVNVPRAPTVVFHQLGGWHGRPPAKRNKMDGDCNGGVDIITVPAVAGRILRFPGKAMHAVPRPVDRWLLTDVEEESIRDEERDEMSRRRHNLDDDADEDEWDVVDDEYDDDDSEQEDDTVERSVILFNTWGNSAPRGVQVDPVGGTIPDGIDIDPGMTEYVASQRKHQFEQWANDYGGSDFPSLHCRPRNEWTEQEIISSSSSSSSISRQDTSSSSPRVALMGQKVRRLYPKKNVRFRVQGDLNRALHETSQPIFLSGQDS